MEVWAILVIFLFARVMVFARNEERKLSRSFIVLLEAGNLPVEEDWWIWLRCVTVESNLRIVEVVVVLNFVIVANRRKRVLERQDGFVVVLNFVIVVNRRYRVLARQDS